MQERAHISFCPITLQVLNYLAGEQGDSCLNSEQIDTLFISGGGQGGGLGGGGGAQAQN